ncbi:MAG: P-loop NTPase, partial [Coriobacteriaceae bacterium]|nr:P-loop NTPase [Coriobacteriaceae bacterium]
MADVWMGLCAEGHQRELMRALKTVDTSARLVFVADAEELRARFLRSAGQMGAIVGMVDEGVSAVNVAAAIVRDAMAAQVVLVMRDRSELERCHAQNAGVDNVVVMTDLADTFGDLDEPDLVEDELPTMVAGMQGRRRDMSRLVPSVITGGNGRMAEEPAGRKAENPDEGPNVTQVEASSSMSNTGRSKGSRVTQARDAHPQAQRPPREESRVTQVGANAVRTSPRSDVPKGSTIVLVSGRGGVGKTALAAVMAYAAASWGMSVALCDLDLSCGNLYHAFGLRGAVDLAGPLENGWPGREEVLALGEEAAPGIHLWGSCARPEMAETVAPHVTDLLAC